MDDDRRRFIFNIFGQGGVGKTTLLHCFRQLAESTGAITACVDENQRDVPNAQAHIEVARSALLAAMDTDTRGAALYGLGGLEALAGNTEQALNYLQQAISLEEEAIRSARHDIAWLDLRTDKRFQMLI